MRNMMGKTAPTKKVDFLGEKNAVELRKLTGKEVRKLQNELKQYQGKDGELKDDESGLAMQAAILRATVVDAEDMTQDDFDTFPLKDLGELAKEALAYSGVVDDESAKND